MTIEVPAWCERVEALEPEQAAAVAACGLVDVRVAEPPDRWRVVAGARVGVARGPGWEVRVMPRLSIPRLMFLLSYAGDRGWRDAGPRFAVEDDLFAAVASAFASHAERALAPAPMRGYRSVEECATTLRGRVRVADQLARWPALPLPLEIVHDEFTADVAENRILRGAVELLLRMPLLVSRARRALLRIRAQLDDVIPERPGTHVAAPPLTRLNHRYGPALALAELILRGCSISTRTGDVAGVAFTFDMNRVFERFLSLALARALERHGGRLAPQRTTHLDADRRIVLRPDLTWVDRGVCRAVVDAKYKALAPAGLPNADAYQMLAYCTALDLDRGWLVYAKDAGQASRDHTIANADTVVHVRAIDLERPPAAVLAEVEALAAEIAQPAPAQTVGS